MPGLRHRFHEIVTWPRGHLLDMISSGKESQKEKIKRLQIKYNWHTEYQIIVMFSSQQQGELFLCKNCFNYTLVEIVAYEQPNFAVDH